ncbi:MAG: hypothetical protein IKN55_04945 [Oscillospiraceae bacterium]|nr:hypothetical protein [Oscillospiraceae bacterium]
MNTPFSFDSARIFLRSLCRAEDAASLVEITLQAFSDAVDAIDAGTSTGRIPEQLCIAVWICGCLLDAAANDSVYEPDAAQYGMADEYRHAERALAEALTRTSGFLCFKKPLHNLRELASLADDCLLLLEHEDYTELGQRLAGTDAGSELIEVLTDLNIRLEDFFNPQP